LGVPIYLVPFCLGFAVLVEVSVLNLRQYWSAPKKDNYELAQFEGRDNCIEMVETDNSRIRVEHHGGRPSANDIMADASSAEPPDIFMCGPVSMTDAIKKETRKEHSLLGFTRFCLYEEPFEM
jgi:predicted ferric reductase